jgi:uncharacterized protein (TIGR02246 family)
MQPEREEEHRALIIRSIHDTIAAFNMRDAHQVVENYAQALDVVTTSGQRLKGQEELEKRLHFLFSRPDFLLKQRLVDVTVRFVRDGVALAHVEIEMSGAVSLSGKPLPPHRELSLRVYIRNDGIWRVSAFHNTTIRTD